MKNLLNLKKPWIWILIAVVAVAVVAVYLLTSPPKTEVPTALDACVVSTLRQVHYSTHTEGKYPSVAYTALSVKEKGDAVTVYGVMLYREYTCTTRDELKIWGSAHSAFAVTAKKHADGSYEATDCWWPEDGAEYARSIKRKFPANCRKQALNAQRYYGPHDAVSVADAREHIAAEEKYEMLKSERENVWLAYCPHNGAAYITSATFSADGTYVAQDGVVTFTFGKSKAAFTVEDTAYVFDEKKSENIPDQWKAIRDSEYLTDGVRFAPDDGAALPPDTVETAPVGPTVTVSAMTWADEATLRDMFGQHVPSSYQFDTADNRYLPVRPIETRGQLERFVATFTDDWSDLKLENFAQYDEEFFKDNYLMMTYFRDGMASCEPAVSSYVYVKEDATLWLSVRLQVEKPAVGDTVLGQWLLFSGIAKEDFKKANALEAYVEKTVTADAAPSNALTFTGKVKQVEGTAVLMECADVPQFSSGVWVELGNVQADPKVGETYVITYEDLVMPSLPPRITAIAITKA